MVRRKTCAFAGAHRRANTAPERGYFHRPLRGALWLLTIICTLSLSAKTQEHGSSVRGSVKGTVERGANAVISIEGKGGRFSVTADADGSYEAHVPPGVYEISAQVPNHYAVRRSPFLVKPQTETVINLRPRVRILEVVSAVDAKTGELRSTVTTAPQPKYESIPILRGGEGGEVREVLIEFSRRLRQGRVTKYKDVTLTYDTVTVHADTVTFDRAKLRLETEGNVQVDDAGKSSDVRGVAIRLRGGRPAINLTGGAIDKVEGEGEIGGGVVTFKFSATGDGAGSVLYEDKGMGVRFTSTRIDSFRVIDDVKNKVTFSGAGILSGRVPPALVYRGGVPVSFTAVVEDSNRAYSARRDSLSIDFHLKGFQGSGDVSSGDIKIHRK